MIWGSGGSKSRFAKAAGAEPACQMRDEKLHAVVARSTFASQKVQNTSASDHFWKLRCRKSARRCGAKHISKSKCTKHTRFGPLLEVQMSKKCTPLWREAHFQVKMYKTPHVRATFGGSDVEKVHAVVARSTFRSQNVKSTRVSDHFWRFRCRKSARRCGAKHISKSKLMLKTPGFRTTFGGSDVASLRFTTLHYIIYTTLHYAPVHYTTLHYTPLHYTTVPSTTLHYITLHSTTLQLQLHNYTPRHSTTLHYTTLHYNTLHYTTLHYATFHYTSLHYTTLYTPLQIQLQLHNYTPLHYNYNYNCTTTLHYTPLHSITLHYTTLHYTPLHHITLHYLPLHSTTLNYTTLHYITLHYTTFHYTPLHYTTLHCTEWHCTTDRQVP